jgi:DAK2 domain fusion protein YloV
MLTVISRVYDIASKSLAYVSGLSELLEIVVKEANKTVKETQFMLPVLEKAGVVDSGGYGLQLILEGMYQYSAGLTKFESLDVGTKIPKLLSTRNSGLIESKNGDSELNQFSSSGDYFHEIEEDDYGYCTQFLVEGDKLDVDFIRDEVSSIGSSTAVIGDSSNVRIHIHLEDPGSAISFMVPYGIISEVSIQNMDQQHEEFKVKNPAALNGFSIVSVAAGSGIIELFREYGVDAIVEAGQTSNPSIKQLLDAIDKVASEEVVLLPNNSNIILSANEAAKSSAKNVSVIPSKSIPQGISALLALDKEKSLEVSLPAALDVIEDICVGEIARSVRSFEIDNGETIAKGEYLGVLNGEVVVGGKDLVEVVLNLIKKGLTDSCELISIYWSDSIGANLAQEISDVIVSKFENIDVEMFEGNQPIYDLIISME